MKRDNIFKKAGKLLSRAKEVSKDKGVYYVIRSGIKITFTWPTNTLRYYYRKISKSSRTFTFQGNTYNYFIHKYNATWSNERTVEVPIIWKIVNESRGKKILEVGNVLSHYFSVNHDILDKYEEVDNVINQDVCDFQSSKKYHLIVSISTLEHVGWDEKPREPMKILQATENLKSLLAPKGKIIVTLPLGYNPEMDRLLNDTKIQFTKMYCLKRISRDNKWIETNWKDVNNAKYNHPFNNANGLVIGIIEKK
ncbi:MAG: hypothetical protein DDT32_01842 [Syntrophomonadaceae bacterium]|nr:hypothetical protein [Bacillota bacterium]